MSVELEIVRDVSERLNRAEIPFMLTGSMAMAAYCRASDDARHRCGRRHRSAAGRCERDSSPAFERRAITSTPGYVARALRRHERIFNAIHQEWIFKVDCIVRKETPYRREEFARRQRVAIADCETWVVGKEDLILSKLCWGLDSRSEYQARDIRNLLKTGCDRDYVMKWAAELGVLDYLTHIEK